MNYAEWRKFFNNYYKLMIAVFLPIVLIPLPAVSVMGRGLYILIIMAVFWITEALPLGVTALLPLVLGPFLAVVPAKEVAPNYFKDVIVLFAGGLMAALCIERWNLHKRISLGVLLICGTTLRWLMLGIMLPSWFLSMWISNTATTAMMLPIVAAVADELPSSNPDDNLAMEVHDEERNVIQQDVDNYKTIKENSESHRGADTNTRKALFLCVAYSATCGGIGTLTGTPPNIILAGTIEKTYGDAAGISFGSWMAFGVPLSFVCVILCWLWLNVHFFGFRKTFLNCGGSKEGNIRKIVHEQLSALGPMSFPEGASLVLFLLLVSLWLTRTSELFTGWGKLVGDGSFASDSTSAMLIVLLMMILPSKPPTFPGTSAYVPMLEWTYVAKNFPWGIVFLLGGGFALGDICGRTGITGVIIDQLSSLKGVPQGAIILVMSLMVATITEVASNTAIANLMLPIIADLALELGIHPLYLMFPVVASCSFAFMLPSATAPNAVVFSQGCVTVWDMMKAGVVLNIVCLLVLQLFVNTLGVAVFDLNTFPDWANYTTLMNSTES